MKIRVTAKILYIDNEKVGIKIYFSEGACQCVLNSSYKNILKDKGLLYEGAEFEILHTVDDDGISTKIFDIY